MPQRKTHNVYLGNQKVGEVWENYDVFTEKEREEKRKKEVLDLYHAKKDAYEIQETVEYKTKEDKAKKNFKIRKTIGIIFMLAAACVPIITMLFFKDDMSPAITFYLPAIIFGLGTGIIHSEAYVSTRTVKPRIDWASCFRWTIAGGVGFLILSLLVLFVLGSII
ncbi:MAG: hypothetical protein IIU80_01390 [Clostridia bacterium]|nr:hypothetical protein [Clostridia bacterium]